MIYKTKILNKVIEKLKVIGGKLRMKVLKAGCILYNKETQKIALICRDGEFSFPKGHLEKGETIEECAIRETIEETGHNCHFFDKNNIVKLEYVTPNGEEVECYYFIAVDDGITNTYINEKDKEETFWIDYSKVESMLAYQNLIDVWHKLKALIKNQF